MKDLSPDIKKQRLDKLLLLKAQKKQAFAEKMQGKILEFLPEEVKDGLLEGYSENYLRLYVDTNFKQDKIIKVKVLEPFKDGAKAQII
jgi:tRNA A37 methylthiotransferase MiaB